MSSKEKAFESLLKRSNQNTGKNNYGKTETHNTKKAVFELNKQVSVELKEHHSQGLHRDTRRPGHRQGERRR